MKKSPVLASEHEFQLWYNENGIPITQPSKGSPDSFPCIAVIHFWEEKENGMDVICQEMDYVYLTDFRWTSDR